MPVQRVGNLAEAWVVYTRGQECVVVVAEVVPEQSRWANKRGVEELSPARRLVGTDVGALPSPTKPGRALPCPVKGLDGHGGAWSGTDGSTSPSVPLNALWCTRNISARFDFNLYGLGK